MKKIVLLTLILTCLVSFPALATPGTHVCQPPVSYSQGVQPTSTYTVTCSWVGDSSTGAVPSVTIPGTSGQDTSLMGWYPYQIDILPGTPAPTGYSMTVTFLIGGTTQDIMGGTGTGISASAGSWQVLTSNSTKWRRLISPLTVNVVNTVASAQGAYTISLIPQ